jgi:hypothetical protein
MRTVTFGQLEEEPRQGLRDYPEIIDQIATVSSDRFTNRPMYSGELACLAGVSADTIRYYERKGLLRAAPRSASGYRLFPQDAPARV